MSNVMHAEFYNIFKLKEDFAPLLEEAKIGVFLCCDEGSILVDKVNSSKEALELVSSNNIMSTINDKLSEEEQSIVLCNLEYHKKYMVFGKEYKL